MSMLENPKQMEGHLPEAQAKRAILYALGRIRDNPQIGYHMGLGTQAFDLLTEAAASLTGKDVAEVRKDYMPRSGDQVHTEVVRKVLDAWGDYETSIAEGYAAAGETRLIERLGHVLEGVRA